PRGKGLLGEPQQHGRVLADRVQEHRPIELRGDLSHHMDALRLQVTEVAERVPPDFRDHGGSRSREILTIHVRGRQLHKSMPELCRQAGGTRSHTTDSSIPREPRKVPQQNGFLIGGDETRTRTYKGSTPHYPTRIVRDRTTRGDLGPPGWHLMVSRKRE